jgi:hypothetical protein
VNQKVAHKLRRPAPLAKISEEAVRKSEAKPVFGGAIHYYFCGCNYIGGILIPARSILVMVLTKDHSVRQARGS